MKLKAALLLCLCATSAFAADERPASYTERPVDFSLRFSRHDYDLKVGTSKFDTSVDRVGVDFLERYAERLQLGLFGGWALLTQTDNPTTAGREINGYYAGVAADFDIWAARGTRVFLNAAFLYQYVDDDDGTQGIVIRWSEPSLRLGVQAALGPNVRIIGGVRYAAINGEQRLSGAVNSTLDIEQTDRSGVFAALQLELGEAGYIGVRAEDGIDRSVGIYFGQRF